jgi:hypothetical protein
MTEVNMPETYSERLQLFLSSHLLNNDHVCFPIRDMEQNASTFIKYIKVKGKDIPVTGHGGP